MAEPATAAAEAEAGVLRSLLEEEEDPPGDVSLMANDTTTTTGQLDVNAIVAQQHAAAHQARAAAALEQADAEERHQDQQQQQQYHHRHHRGDGSSQQLQHQVTIASTPSPIVTQDLGTQGVQKSGAGLQTDLENETSLAAGPPDLTLSAVPPPSICLCQQPARIPRPRNAFILFRQHNQAAVVAQHPGKPNPEISKIIGEMWRESPQETKHIWQKHADEEKKQHLARYPEYRYQPRRNGKKNAAAAAAAFSSAGTSGALSPSIETTICQTCGGRTGTLSTPQTPATPLSAVPKTPRLPPPQISRPPSTAPPPAKKRRTDTSEDTISQTSPTSTTVDAAGVEALLQLGHLQDTEDPASSLPGLSTPHKKRKHGTETSPMSAILTTTNTITPLQHNLYTHFPPPVHDPNIDPFLRQNGFESESPTTTLDHEGNLTSTGPHGLPTFAAQLEGAYIIKSIPILEKIHAFSKICKPLSAISGPGFPRMPIVAVEGDDAATVTDLFNALAKDIRKSEPLQLIDEPDMFDSDEGRGGGDIDDEGMLIHPASSSGGGKELDADDVVAARYLAHVAGWRRRCIDIRKTVLPQSAGALSFAPTVDAVGAPAVVLVNRYMVSRSDLAAGRLVNDGLTPVQHWQWCATVWRGCVGADMTIVVNMVGEGVGSEEAVEVKEGGRVVFVRKEGGRKGWEEKVVRRLGFEVGEVVRSLRGFGG